ncbi:phytoene desaturase family protein [Azospirillum canadense]|uniref:phytoene desaturase family protein n=1 Tax=Azospirillum canadense TaxID=403962 RepID=UPI0022263D85|nr:phytoene desaturase family protein [Azospirillum canadense]MCW2236422.1 phytoene desaturase [Azospirillum canadense]
MLMKVDNNRAGDNKVAVIGGGLAGLASAVVLAARGHSVVLFERNAWLGGKAAVLEEDGFRFDMGPTILTVPRVLRRIFAEAGRDMDKELDLIRLDPQWRCFFEDGSVLDLAENVDAMAATLDRFAPGAGAGPGAGEGYRRFMALSERLHGISERFFFWKAVEDLTDTLDFKNSLNAATLSDVLALRMGTTVAGTIRGKVPDGRVAQMLDHFTQYVGSSPYGSPAVLCAIAHMQTNDGVWYPRGGTRAVPVALERLVRDLGVDIRTGTGIRRIEVEKDRVVGVETATGERVPVSAVVSNMDSVRTYNELVCGAPAERFNKRRKYEPACSGVVFYLGLDRAYEHLAHHDFVFSRDPEEEFDWIYRRGEPAPDPTCYIAAPSRTEPEVAPPGGEALYVLVHTPYLRPHHDWKRMLPDYRRVVFDKLKRTGAMPDLEDRIRVERVLTPQDIHDRYNVLNGAIYGLASHGRFMGAFKPGNRSREVQGLYLAGGAAHPGPGMPMVLMSGWIAADTLDQDMGRELGGTVRREVA